MNGALIFDSADDMLAAMFGPPQQDHHVKRRNFHLRAVTLKAAHDAYDARVAAKVKQYGSYTAWLRAEPAKGEA
jgi:hypothetical protein